MRLFIIAITVIMIPAVLGAQNHAPVVENVRFQQRTNGTLLVDVYYDVYDADGDTLDIIISASDNAGLTWDLPCAHTSGDLGSGILSSSNKHIVWDFYSDNPGVSGSSYCVQVTADDKQPEIVICQDIDGNLYKTIKIGNQWWMAENLKVTHYRNGDAIQHVTGLNSWSSLTTGAYCNFNNNEANVATYGKLYNWYAVNESRNIAPAGWHIPSKAEWVILRDYLGGTRFAGEKMKEAGTAHWAPPNTGATNESGFTALPGGFRNWLGYFAELGESGTFWSSTEYDSSAAWCLWVYYRKPEAFVDRLDKPDGFSIRCLRD